MLLFSMSSKDTLDYYFERSLSSVVVIQLVICCASVQSVFPAVLACYAMSLNLSCALDIMRQELLLVLFAPGGT